MYFSFSPFPITEIRQFCVAVQTSILDDIVDRDVQKGLYIGQSVQCRMNWSPFA